MFFSRSTILASAGKPIAVRAVANMVEREKNISNPIIC